MRNKSAANSDWQECGGKLEIPDGWFVTRVDLDCHDPYVEIETNSFNENRKKLPVPKSLAYYLSFHFCGSNRMSELIQHDTRREVRNDIKRALGLDGLG